MPEKDTKDEAAEAKSEKPESKASEGKKAPANAPDPADLAVKAAKPPKSAGSSDEAGGTATKEKQKEHEYLSKDEAKELAKSAAASAVSQYHESLKEKGLLRDPDDDPSGQETDLSQPSERINPAEIEERAVERVRGELRREQGVRDNLALIAKEYKLTNEQLREFVDYVSEPDKNGHLYNGNDFMRIGVLKAAYRDSGIESRANEARTGGPNAGTDNFGSLEPEAAHRSEPLNTGKKKGMVGVHQEARRAALEAYTPTPDHVESAASREAH